MTAIIGTLPAQAVNGAPADATAVMANFNFIVSQVNANTPAPSSFKIQPIDASVASNAITLTLNPTTLDFRSLTVGSGVVNTRTVAAAISLVVPTLATLGMTSAIASRLLLLAIDNSGTVELAVVNEAGGNALDESGVINTTAISAAATSASVIYSITARTNVPYRVIGYVDITEATAGTWATAPTTIQGQGGQALAAMSSLGYGQTYQDVTGSRALATTYTNTTGKPFLVFIISTNGADYGYTQLAVNGIPVVQGATRTAGYLCAPVIGIIPPGATYAVTGVNGTATITKWFEVR